MGERAKKRKRKKKKFGKEKHWREKSGRKNDTEGNRRVGELEEETNKGRKKRIKMGRR